MNTTSLKAAVVLLLGLTTSAFASPGSAPAADPQATTATSTRQLAQRLTANVATQREKAHAIYTWITTHVSYDQRLYTQSALVRVEPAAVLREGKTICEGYARLFNELCAQSGIESVKVVGVTKGGGVATERHAWNLVKLDGKWVEVDATWGSSFHTDFYFATDPTLFQYTHYAQAAAQQLAPVRMSPAQFAAQDGLRGDDDPFWRAYHAKVEDGTYHSFAMTLK